MTSPYNIEQKLAAIFSGYVSTAAALTYGVPTLTEAPRRVPQDGDTETAPKRLEINVLRDSKGLSASTIKLEFHLYDPQDVISREVAETKMTKLRQYLYHDDLAAYIDDLDSSLASGWAFASGIRDDAVEIDLMSDKLERRFSVAVSFDIANNPGS